ncbi:hypothetical protein MMC10_004208 [Thelotrema lepadinum]|nr:hypothetical protein [Thelotrema lepadinum]
MPRPRYSQSDDEDPLQPSDNEVLQEEEDRERLLATRKSSIKNILKPNDDPNKPKPLTQRQMRRQKRKRRRSNKRDGGEDEALMFEMEDGKSLGEEDDSDASSTSSAKVFIARPQTRWSRRRKLLHFIFIPLGLVILFGLFVFGAYRASNQRKTLSIPPKTPKILRSNGTSNFAPTTILISLDGFRADFLNRGLTPTLNRFIKEGVSPKYMLPSFPSLTFPNHWSIVTGLYPESHGIVGNTFWDPALEEEFYYTDPARSMQAKWWTSTGAEPLWSTCEAQGVRSAVHMWPGSEAGIAPEPQTVDKFNGTELLSRKVSRVLSFLDRPSEHDSPTPPSLTPSTARPQFIAMYVPNVDADGHKYGPNSTEIRNTISSVDAMLSSLFTGLTARNLTDIVNIIVLSDHGMATTSTSRLIQLESLLDPADIAHIDGWPLYGLRPNPSVDIDVLHTTLRRAAQEHGHFKVYTRTTFPPSFHFSLSPRIAPLWLVPDPGWAIVRADQFNATTALREGSVYHPRGLHGYDADDALMRAIFVARGPAFPHVGGSAVDVFRNVEVYGMVCASLGVEGRKNNGSLEMPLVTVGVHGDEEGEDEKLDFDLPVDEPVGAGADGEGGLEEEGGEGQGEGGSLWEKIKDKAAAAKAWLGAWFGAIGKKLKGGG